jgi:hypothetical protein
VGPGLRLNARVKLKVPLHVTIAVDEPSANGTRRSTPADFERIRQERVIQHAQEQADNQPNENAAHWARLDHAYSSSANDADGRKGEEGGRTKATSNKDGSSARGEGENNAAQFLAETAGCSEGINPVQSN